MSRARQCVGSISLLWLLFPTRGWCPRQLTEDELTVGSSRNFCSSWSRTIILVFQVRLFIIPTFGALSPGRRGRVRCRLWAGRLEMPQLCAPCGAYATASINTRHAESSMAVVAVIRAGYPLAKQVA